VVRSTRLSAFRFLPAKRRVIRNLIIPSLQKKGRVRQGRELVDGEDASWSTTEAGCSRLSAVAVRRDVQGGYRRFSRRGSARRLAVGSS
jgi:hypothetical protein